MLLFASMKEDSGNNGIAFFSILEPKPVLCHRATVACPIRY